MPDNPHSSALCETALPHRVLQLEGRDALAFAQAQTMNDVRALADGQWQWNGWLNPKGRVLALFALLRIDAQTLWLLLPDADAGALAAQLQRFVLRSKLALQVRDDLHAAGALAAPQQAAGNQSADVGGTIELDMGGDGGPRRLRIGTATAPVSTEATLAWMQADLAHGLPYLGATGTGEWTPQQLSLERLRAFSLKKGCYPGQEIVARTHYLGQAKRGLALCEADAPLAAGSEVRCDGDACGRLVSAAGALALAVLPLGRDAGALEAGAQPLRVRPLLGGLAR
ncbi:YgfZ/GcvT domain-containing protein [Thermomonas flagellata]|uniref:CAF17-like 4Fe-4S cluster assembly/insertion protein YgfZ n=1 Tax=Thermomonas flagellata TaxID=2888524 RepID=UPI003CE54069